MHGERPPASDMREARKDVLVVSRVSEEVVRLEAMDIREAVRHAGGMGSLMSRDGRVGRVPGVGVTVI